MVRGCGEGSVAPDRQVHAVAPQRREQRERQPGKLAGAEQRPEALEKRVRGRVGGGEAGALLPQERVEQVAGRGGVGVVQRLDHAPVHVELGQQPGRGEVRGVGGVWSKEGVPKGHVGRVRVGCEREQGLGGLHLIEEGEQVGVDGLEGGGREGLGVVGEHPREDLRVDAVGHRRVRPSAGHGRDEPGGQGGRRHRQAGGEQEREQKAESEEGEHTRGVLGDGERAWLLLLGVVPDEPHLVALVATRSRMRSRRPRRHPNSHLRPQPWLDAASPSRCCSSPCPRRAPPSSRRPPPLYTPSSAAPPSFPRPPRPPRW